MHTFLRCRFSVRLNFPLIAIALAGILAISGIRARAQGEDLFKKHCAVCHSIGQGKLTGPDLMKVHEKYDENWLIKFVQSSQTMIKAGDPQAVKAFNENGKVLMPDFKQLKEDEIKQIIGYIKDYDPDAGKSKIANLSDTNYTEIHIKRGERLFKGLIAFENSKVVCGSCHNTVTLDTINWYPSAAELAAIYKEKGSEHIFKVLTNPTTKVMKQVHENSRFSEEEIFYIRAYLSHISKHGLEKARKFPFDFMVFLGLGLIMSLALIDLIFTRKFIKYKILHFLIILAGLGWQLKIVAHEAVNLSRTKNYAPDQPIKFSHAVHAGQNQIDCQYCHSEVNHSKSAGFPTAQLCMNCHKVVREGTITGAFEIAKISSAIDKNTPIRWTRIHKLPDHVFFSHAQHTAVGGIDCEKCHGDVKNMHLIKQFSDLSMGFCVNCHRETEVQFMSNEYYKHYMKLHDDIKSGRKTKITAEDIGGLDCMKCHY